MFHNLIKLKKDQWLESKECGVKELLSYIRQKDMLRHAQIEAIGTYLYLKIEGDNKPLYQLFLEGFFTDIDISQAQLTEDTRSYLKSNKEALALYSFSSQATTNNLPRLPRLKTLIEEAPEKLNYEDIIKRLFYGVSYADYLLSLPMGAGKTYLMAAFIYIDLYFADNEPDNRNFAHNFLVLIPSGLKTSIAPSLKTIEKFDPSWVIAEPTASNLKRQLVFEVLDDQKTSKKSNQARNPNAQKVNQCLPEPFGRVFVVNAEKVILNKLDLSGQEQLLKCVDDVDIEDKKANELRNLIGKIPNLSILIDEVHHASNSDIKLRQVVTNWNATGNITTVLGFSGTPYLSKPESIQLTNGESLRLSEITNTVHYYPLITAIENFLKKPIVKIATGLKHLQIVKKGIEDFNQNYYSKVYADGTIAKVAIYCSDINMLEEQIYPYLLDELNINANEILRFHGGNTSHSLPQENELQFKSLDTPLSTKKYILLVGIGKEGWDCKSLTSVILPQKSKSTSKNTIIQTTCRCLRQVVKGNDETALIWLNQENAEILNKQLKAEQNTSIQEITKTGGSGDVVMIDRVSRMEVLKLPAIDYYQLDVTYQSIEQEESANTKTKLEHILDNIERYKMVGSVRTTDLNNLGEGDQKFVVSRDETVANYNTWVFNIAKESLGTITSKIIHGFDEQLKPIFEKITFTDNNSLLFNDNYDLYQINSKIRVAFSVKKLLRIRQEIIPKNANLLIVDKLETVENNDNLYPNQEVSKQILDFDQNPLTEEQFDQQKEQRIARLVEDRKFAEAGQVNKERIDPITIQRNKSFHILPYKFDSRFEYEMLARTLRLVDFKDSNLEIYFNGERGLTEFVINCFANSKGSWKHIGKYTTDFLMIKRNEDNNQIDKALIIETKGKGFANDPIFIKKKTFVETAFLEQNNEKFGYQKFDFIYLEDSVDFDANLEQLNTKINTFFVE